MEQAAQAWIEAVTGERFTSPFEEFLKSGEVLCRLINVIKPSSVTRINKMKQPLSPFFEVATRPEISLVFVIIVNVVRQIYANGEHPSIL